MPPIGDDQDKIVLARQVEKRIERLNGAAVLRYWQRQHAGRSTASDRWRCHHLPSIGSDFHGAPVLIGEIKIEAFRVFGDTDVDHTPPTVELCARFQGAGGVVKQGDEREGVASDGAVIYGALSL